ncbi:unnamed protein product [Rhizoctonia solani]|uniref:F-box domain-containing protein n=1 Tax=Rhizoctonia solani TaxID=456999 RepID=A0A8H2XAQ4_9AGAM|nr:unnamed protein product [Rhizoctonia solani]CAE6532236.1 unnamed protein product [Rhizoctonia solani]
MAKILEPPSHHAFQKWKEARKALDHAIQNFLDSTIALQSFLFSTHSSEASSLRNYLAKTPLDDPPALDSRFAQAQAHLNQITNSFLSINTLPLEILLNIFRIACFNTFHSQYDTPIPFNYRQDDHRGSLVLTHVCSSWRTFLLATPTFWSQFLLDPRHPLAGECERAQMYSSRAHDALQSLSIYAQLNDRCFYLRDSEALAKIIQPRAGSLTQIALLNFKDPQLVCHVVKLCLKNGKPGVLRALVIQLETDNMSCSPIDTSSVGEAMLGPIRVLSLRGIVFTWYSSVYWNLVVLHIGNVYLGVAPTISEIQRILSACPLLHTLRLYDMRIRPDRPAIPLQKVYLAELVDLNLAALQFDSMDLLLASIYPQHKDLSLRIACPHWDTQAFGTLYPFLARTNVARLFIEQLNALEPGDVIGRCLSALPDLHTLVLDLSMKPGDSYLSGLTYLDELNTRFVPRCPKLHTLHCVTGSVTIAAVQQIVETHPSMQKLRFSACYIEPFEDELLHWLKPFVKDVKFDLRPDMAALFDWYHTMT